MRPELPQPQDFAVGERSQARIEKGYYSLEHHKQLVPKRWQQTSMFSRIMVAGAHSSRKDIRLATCGAT
jgi:hypothetical protein